MSFLSHIPRPRVAARALSHALRTGIPAVVALSCLLALAAPLNDAAGRALEQSSISTSRGGAPHPVLHERQERQASPASREYHLAVPPAVLERSPVGYAAVVLVVRDEPPLDSYFVYTQTTSSRL